MHFLSSKMVGHVLGVSVKVCCLCFQVTLRGTDIDKGVSCRTSGVQINAIPTSEAEGSV